MYRWQIKILESVIIVTCNIINCQTGLIGSLQVLKQKNKIVKSKTIVLEINTVKQDTSRKLLKLFGWTEWIVFDYFQKA